MVEDAEGFLIPEINTDLCIECGACVASCPVLTKPNRDSEFSHPNVFAGYINDAAIRQKSSSGGMFTAIASKFFEQESDNKKYLVAAQFDEHLELNHVVVDSIESISKMRCSKYVQSRIGDSYRKVKDLLKEGSQVLFVGTPCQVAGLNSFLGNKQYDNLLTVDLICHGVPSARLFSSYLEKIGIGANRVYSDYLFRATTTTTGYFTSSYIDKNGKSHKVPTGQHSYIMAYLKGWLHRECCYNCQFNGIPRQADITIGDFWGIIGGKVPFNGERGNGISEILGNTKKGKRMVSAIASLCYFEPKTVEEAIIDNHNLFESDKRPDMRDVVYEELTNMSPKQFMVKHNLQVPHTTLRQKIRCILSKLYHVIFK